MLVLLAWDEDGGRRQKEGTLDEDMVMVMVGTQGSGTAITAAPLMMCLIQKLTPAQIIGVAVGKYSP